MRFLLYSLVDVLSAAVVAVPLVWLFQRFRGERGWTRYVLSGLFVLYLCEMFDVVGIPAIQYIRWEPNISLIPFSDETHWLGVQRVLNAVMFAPLGFLLPLFFFLKTFPLPFTLFDLLFSFFLLLHLLL